MSSKFNSMKHIPETFSVPHDKHSMSFYKVINQVDFVSTISYLFGIPIPKNNLGMLLLDLIGDIDGKYFFLFRVFFNYFSIHFFEYYLDLEKLRALQLNAHQLSGILKSLWTSFDRNP